MKKWKKIVCILMAAIILAITPAGDYLNANDMKSVDASAALGGAAVLEVIMAGLGVTVAAGAKAGITDAFTSWVSDNGTDDVKSTWNNGLLGGTPSFRITSSLASSVAGFLGAKYFSNLNSGAVNSVEYRGDTTNLSTATIEQKLVVDYISNNRGISAYNRYAIFSLPSTSEPTRCAYMCGDNTNVLVCTLSDGRVGTCFFGILNSGSLSLTTVRTGYELTSSLSYKSSSFSASWIERDITQGVYRGNVPVYRLNINAQSFSLPSDITTLRTMASSISAGGQTVKDALTSYGGYDNANITALDGLVINDSVASSIMSNVTTAVNNNKTDSDDDTVGVIWSDAIAQAVSDAYAKGIEDAKAEQDTLEEEIKKEESEAATNGFLSQILEAIKALPALIFGQFGATLTDGFSILANVFQATENIHDLITDIPSVLVKGFQEVFPTADKVVELITGIPASMVHALSEVFPVAEDLREWITTVPGDIVDALSEGLGTLQDGLISVRDAVLTIPDILTDSLAAIGELVLSIPQAIVDAITLVLEAIFVPDLTIVEPELEIIGDSFAWVVDLNDLINDFMLKLQASDPPVLYLDFTKAGDSKYHGAGQCLAIDFSWYGKYKPTGDLVFGAFLWVLYIWYLFKRIPDIISGAGFITRDSINFDNRMNNKNKGGNE